jgi:hypothetical protein
MRHRPASIVQRQSSSVGILCVIGFFSFVSPAAAQDRVRFGANVGRQATTADMTEVQTFQQYFEEARFTFERTTPADLFYDASVGVRVWRGLQAGFAVSFFESTGPGDIEANVPHPLQFNRPRTTESELSGITRREIGQHVSAGWIIPAAAGIDFTVFGGPSFFVAEQTFVTGLTMSLDKEVFPFTALAFPGATTTIERETVIGYNLGVDMTWRFADHIGVGALFRYSAGKKDFEPAGSTVEVNVGGLHAGGGLRVSF